MQRFWLRHWGHGCPKRTSLWSLSPAIKVFDQGSLKGLQRKASYKSAVVYTDRRGKKCYKGSEKLKSTGTLGCSLAHFPYSDIHEGMGMHRRSLAVQYIYI